MRRILVPFALGGLLSASVVACDVEDPFNPSTDTTNGSDTAIGTDTNIPPEDTAVVEDEYYAVIVDDSEIFPTHRIVGTDPCATNREQGAHGADIDAVAMFDENNNLIGYFESVRLAAGTQCEIPAKFADIGNVKGEPDLSINEGFVSLGGGYVIGEFDESALILPGHSIQVFEIDKDVGSTGADEGYDVFVATDLGCGQSGGSRSGCQVKIGTGTGSGTFNNISGF